MQSKLTQEQVEFLGSFLAALCITQNDLLTVPEIMLEKLITLQPCFGEPEVYESTALCILRIMNKANEIVDVL